MKIRTKEDFIDLFLTTQLHMGLIVSTFNFSADLLPMIEDRKYSDLFYFFRNMKDLDFSRRLEEFSDGNSLSLIHRDDDSVTIKLKNLFYFHIQNFDEASVTMMSDLINTILDNRKLNYLLRNYQAHGNYNQGNPNHFYQLEENDRIFVNGDISEVSSNRFLVENSSFSIVESFTDGQLKSVDVTYLFDYEQYLEHIIKETLSMENAYFEKSDFSFKEIKQGKVFQKK